MIFLRFADYKFTVAKREIERHRISSRHGITKADYQAKGVLYLPENARFSYLLNLPEGENIGKAIDSFTHTYFPKGYDVKKLKGVKNTYRLRIGGYRIIYMVDFKKSKIFALAVSQRKKAY